MALQSLPDKQILPIGLVIDISAACNAQCFFCARKVMPKERTKGFMGFDLFLQILEEAESLGIKILRLYNTGEPTLHPEFDRFVNYAKERGFFIKVSTNAATLRKHFETVSRVDVLQFSVEGWDKESYERYRYPLKFEAVYNSIKDFARLPGRTAKTQVNLLLNKKTRIKEYFQTWSPHVDGVVINTMHPFTCFDGERFFGREVPDLLPLLESQNSQPCFLPFREMTIQHDGKIALCCRDFFHALDLGNVQQGVATGYNGKLINDIRNQFIQGDVRTCADCSFSRKTDAETTEQKTNEILEVSGELGIQDKISISL